MSHVPSCRTLSTRLTQIVAVLCLLVGTSRFVSAEWTPVQSPESDFIEGFFSLDGDLYIGTLTGQVMTSTDHGESWEAVGSGLSVEYAPVITLERVGDWLVMSRSLGPDYVFRAQWDGSEWGTWSPVPLFNAPVYEMTAIDDSILALMNGIPYRSDDYGATWNPAQPHGVVNDLFSAGGVLFGSDGLINGGNLYRSDDIGQTWGPVGTELGSSFVLCHTFIDGIIWVSVYHNAGIGSLWTSSDLGLTWDELTTLPAQTNINGMVDTPAGLLIGSSGDMPSGDSIFYSSDLAAWQAFTEGLPEAAHPVNELVSHDGWIFKTGGVTTPYRSPEPSAPTAVEEQASEANDLTIFPNPMRDGTEIRFSTSGSGQISIRVHDIGGRYVRDLSTFGNRGEVGAVRWDGRDESGNELASGLYLVRVTSEGRTQVGKLWLAR